MMKVEVEVNLHDDKEKRKALKSVSDLLGIRSIAVKDKKLTVNGNVNPVDVHAKVQKHWPDAKLVKVEEIKTTMPNKEPERRKPNKEAERQKPNKEPEKAKPTSSVKRAHQKKRFLIW